MAATRALERARSMLGVPFRLQGRDATAGLDCIGLVIAAYRLPHRAFPDDYRLNSRGRCDELLATVGRVFRRVRRGEPGHLVVMRFGRGRMHLGLLAPGGVIHADLRRGAVIEGPVPAGAEVVAIYRKRRMPLSKGMI